jgi:hypothetical protein
MSQINVGFDNNSPQAIDRAYGKVVAGVTVPFASVAEANAMVNVAYRHKGKTVLIIDGATVSEFWWKDGTANVNLVKKADYSTLQTIYDLVHPEKLELSANGTYTVPEDILLYRIVVVTTVNFVLQIGSLPGQGDIVPEIPVVSGEPMVIDLSVVGWGASKDIYLQGISGFTIFLMYRDSLTPINP